MKACIVFKDGTERPLILPDRLQRLKEFVTSHPSEPLKNIRVRFIRMTSRLVSVYHEVGDDD